MASSLKVSNLTQHNVYQKSCKMQGKKLLKFISLTFGGRLCDFTYKESRLTES